MTQLASPTDTTRTRLRKRSIALAALIAAVITSVVNVGIGSVALALGATPTPQLNPGTDIAFSVIASVAGAIGWSIVARRARDPRRVLRVLVPATLLVSFVPDALLAAATVADTGWGPIIALLVMHVATIVLAVGTYSYLLPVRTRQKED